MTGPAAPPLPDDAGSRWGGSRWLRPTDPHVLGDPDAPVGLVVWADFCCPYCAAAAPVLSDLVSRAHDRFALSFRHFPRPDVHAAAVPAALLSELAHDHELFWPLHDDLFAHGGDLHDDTLASSAHRLGLPGNQRHGRHHRRRADRIQQDRDAGVAAGVVATPALFVAGEAYAGEITTSALLAAADAVHDHPS